MGCVPQPEIIETKKRQPVRINLSRPYDFSRQTNHLTIASEI